MHSHLNVYPSGYMPYLNKYLISCLIPVSINPYELNFVTKLLHDTLLYRYFPKTAIIKFHECFPKLPVFFYGLGIKYSGISIFCSSISKTAFINMKTSVSRIRYRNRKCTKYIFPFCLQLYIFMKNLFLFI